jgi:hypothetical protein
MINSWRVLCLPWLHPDNARGKITVNTMRTQINQARALVNREPI